MRRSLLRLLAALALPCVVTSAVATALAPFDARAGARRRGREDPGLPAALAATVIHGAFDLSPGRAGTSPDGDTVRFVPDRPELACGRRGCPEGVNVRMASVDALELHYDCGAQDLALATAARDRLLALLGFREVRYRAGDRGMPTVAAAAPGAVRGHVLSLGQDTTGRRPVVYAFAGAPPEPDGAVIRLEPDRVARSVNAALLAEGLAFPAYFADSTTPPIRAALDALVARARERGAGVWAPPPPALPAGAGFDVSRAWPPVARSYCRWALAGDGAYLAWLAGPDGGPGRGHRYWQRSRERWVRLSEVVRAEGGALKLDVPPEDLVARP